MESGVEARIKAAASKTIEDFWVSEKYHDEKVEFATDAYIDGKQLVHDKDAAQYPELDLDILDEVWEPPAIDAATMSAPTLDVVP